MRFNLFLLFSFASLSSSCSSMSSIAQPQESPQALQAAYQEALLAGDAQRFAEFYTDDAILFFPVGSLSGVGPKFAVDYWGSFFEDFRVIDAELFDTHVEIHGDVAVAWGLWRISAEPLAGGEPIESTGRFMDFIKKIDGKWLFAADHASVPIPAD